MNIPMIYLVHFFAYFTLLISIIALIIHFKKALRTYEILTNKQKADLKAERLRISGEIHDEIGPGLFAIKLLAEKALDKEANSQDLQQIRQLTTEVSEKINEIIWSTNIENDNIESLLYYIQAQTSRQFDNTDINYTVSLQEDIPTKTISGRKRKAIYLIVKELTHNTIKHSKASNAKMTAYITGSTLMLITEDDGIGFEEEQQISTGMGLTNIKARVESLGGIIQMYTVDGTKVIIHIPL